MPDPEPSLNVVVIIGKNCWSKPVSQWRKQIHPAVVQTLQAAEWTFPGELNVLLTDDSEIQHLNKNHRHLDKPTNVLSFPSLTLEEIADLKIPTDIVFLGDIALSYQTIQQEALEQQKSFHHHFIHLVVHGVLHLLGFDHENDQDAHIMESLEIKILSALSIPNPYLE